MRKGKNLQKNIIEVAPEMLSRKELSYLIGVSVLTLLSWKEKGSLVPVELGATEDEDKYSKEQISCFSNMVLSF